MLLIPCPYCGPRAQTEFSYGGDATIARPGQGDDPAQDAVAKQQWLDHIYLRDNPRGPHLEWWQHHSGCRAWFKVRRDTATHEVLGAWRVGEEVDTIGAVTENSDESAQ